MDSFYGGFQRGQEASAQLQQTQARTAEIGVDTQLKQQQFSKIQEASGIKAQARAAVEKLGKDASAQEQMQAYTNEVMRHDPVAGAALQEESLKLESSALKNKEEALKLSKTASENDASLIRQGAVSPEEAIRIAQAHFDDSAKSPEDRAANANRLALIQAIQEDQMTGGKKWPEMQAKMNAMADAKEPETLRLKALAIAEKVTKDQNTKEHQERQDREKQLHNSQMAVLKQQGLEKTKEATDKQITYKMQAETYKYHDELDKQDKAIEHLDAVLAGSGRPENAIPSQIVVEKKHWGPDIMGPNPVYEAIQKKKDAIEEKKRVLTAEHDYNQQVLQAKLAGEPPPPRPSVAKPVETPVSSPSSSGEGLPMPASASEAVKDKVYATPRGLAKWDGKQFIPVTKEEPAKDIVRPTQGMSQEDISSRIAEINKIITPSGDRISIGKTSYIEAENLKEERRKLKQKLYS